MERDISMKRFASAALGSLICAGFATSAASWSFAETKEAIAVINPASSSSVKGVVRFTLVDGQVKVAADLEGLEPNTKHGFHVHEFGDCSAADATSAGSHYDAMATKHHGQPVEKMRHAGDMGNIEADGSGKVHLELNLGDVTIDGSQAPLLGRGVIVHAKVDDFSQPVGNAGARLGCGVIGIMKPSK
jgi:Cu-Zn family superoxide dismutase